MQQRFDPYWQWLGIRPVEQPPNHYHLLGLAPLEGDSAVILRAIEERTALVHACAGASYPEALEQMLGELANARHLLLNPALKQQYDAMLRAHAGMASPGAYPAPGVVMPAPIQPSPQGAVYTPAAAAAPAGSPVEVPVIVTDATPGPAARAAGAGAPAAANGGAGGGEQSQAGMPPAVIAAIVGGGAVLLGVLAVVMATSGPGNETASRSGRSSRASSFEGRAPSSSHRPRSNPPRRSPSSQPSSRPSPSWRGGTAPPLGSRTMADLMNQDDNAPPDTRSTTGLLKAARVAMADRQLAAARHHVEAAAAGARSPTERAEVQRVQKLLEALEAFWKAVGEQVARLQVTQEVVVGQTRAVVVEVDRSRLIMKVAGKLRIYNVPGDLPRPLAVALAERHIGTSSPIANLRIGAFLAIDAKGDRQEARRRWQNAGAEGKALMPELELAGPVKNSGADAPGPHPGGKVAGTPKPGPHPGAEPPPKRLPVPDAVALATAEQRVRALFKDEFAGARNKDGKVALAKRMYKAAEDTKDNPAARYFMYQVARDKAVELGDPESFFWAIGRLDHFYKIDAIQMKADLLAKAWREQTESDQRRAVYDFSKRLLDEAMKAKRYKAADRVVRVAVAGAKAERNFALVRELEEKARVIDKNGR